MKGSLISFLILSAFWLDSEAQIIRVNSNSCIKMEAGSHLDLGSGSILLESDHQATASLLDLGLINYSSGGEIQVQRYITPGKWHLISSPVTVAEAGIFINDYLQQHQEPTNQWEDVISANAPLEVMKGYSLWSTEAMASNELFTGATNTGSIQIGFTNAGSGYNLLGNPYPSSIAWDAVTMPPGLNGQFYLWDPEIGSSGDYVYYIEGGGPANTCSGIIAPGQGFFVEANAAGTFTLTNDARVHSSQPFYKETAAMPLIVLKATAGGVTGQTAVRFSEQATNDVDRLLDVKKLFSGNEDIPDIYSFAGDVPMSINSLPHLNEDKSIPLEFSAGFSGSVTLTAGELHTIPEEYSVILEDKHTGQFRDLRQSGNHNFEYNSGDKRAFVIHLKTSTGFGEEPADNNLPVTATFDGDVLHLNILNAANKIQNKHTVRVYSVGGQLLYQGEFIGPVHNISFPYAPSLYLIEVTSGSMSAGIKAIKPRYNSR